MLNESTIPENKDRLNLRRIYPKDFIKNCSSLKIVLITSLCNGKISDLPSRVAHSSISELPLSFGLLTIVQTESLSVGHIPKFLR